LEHDVCFLERYVGEFPSLQQKIQERKIKTANNSHLMAQMKEPAEY
jgi:hypothetical protein